MNVPQPCSESLGSLRCERRVEVRAEGVVESKAGGRQNRL
eukprot:COSAG03_NODE_18264_length_358_cov_1.204633_2_plen_39_part_01